MPSLKSAPRGMSSSLAGLEEAAYGRTRRPIVRAAAWRVRLPLRLPVVTANRTLRIRDGAVVLLQDAEGQAGWGEALPLAGFGRPRWRALAPALSECLAAAVGRLPAEAISTLQTLPVRDATGAAAVFATEAAALDLLAQQAGVPLRELFSPRPADTVAVNALLIGDTPPEVAASAERAWQEGYQAVKLKVGGRALEADLARVRAARAALGPTVALRLDANGAWSESEAARALERLAEFGIDYIEQPLPPGDLAALARLRASRIVPIAADEGASSLEDVEELLAAQAVDVLVLKPAVLGGLLAVRRAAHAAAAAGVRAVLTSALEGSIAVVAAAQLAGALPDRQVAHGLATLSLLARDVTERPPAIVRGRLVLSDEVGLGVKPAPRAVAGRPFVEVRA